MIKKYDYDSLAKYYYALEEDKQDDFIKNRFLENIFKKYKTKKVFDVSCGTGVQTIYLHKKGYDVKASDLSEGMLKIARKRAKEENLKINFKKADMTEVKHGKADAVVSIFNAIGHLSQKQFIKMIKNMRDNLKDNGLFVFDIFNLDFFKGKGFVDYEFIDCAKTIDDIKFVRFNDNDLDLKENKLIINQKIYIQEGYNQPKIIKDSCDMKLYDYKTLKELLEKNGFEIVEKYGSAEKEKLKKNSVSIYIVARKK